MKKNIEGKEEKNPYHREYGLASNIRYTLGKMLKYEPYFYWMIPCSVIGAPVMRYLWTFLSKFVLDLITSQETERRLLWMMALFVMIQIAATMLNTYFRSETWWRYISVRFEMMIEKNTKVMTMDFQNLEDSDVMDCFQKASNSCGSNMEGIEGMMHTIVSFIANAAIVAVGIAILSSMNFIVVLMMTVLAVINFFLQNHTNKKAKREVWDPLATWWRKHYYIQETTTDFKTAKEVRMFGLRDWLLQKYREINQVRYEAQKKSEKIWFAVTISYNCLWAAAQVILYGWLIRSVIHQQITIGNFSLYLASAATLFECLKSLLLGISDLLARSREVDDFRSFLDLKNGEEDTQGEPVPELDRYEFTFRNVSFRYPKAETDALKDLNLTLKSGERLAVVGLNGAGKTTMIKLLLRLYEPTQGEILLNGVNIKKYNRQSYYRIFSPVFQEVQLFAFPMSENVSMKSPGDTQKKQSEEALIKAGLGKKLQELPQGVDTELMKIIYDDGIDLSGGEKQKLGLARALYKDAPVVVLDEPTAALDALAESQLYQDFDQLIGGKTAVYISHRLSSTQFCSNVAMFENGTMVEYGTHKSLMEQNGAYANMFRIQAQYYVDNPESEVAASV